MLQPFHSRTIIEPFRIRTVEPIRFSSMEHRENLLREAGYNPFLLKSEDVLIDLLTDSGTGALSSLQMGSMISSDESYAGSSSFSRLESAVRNVMGFEYVIPTHQGRAAENILFSTLAEPHDIVPSNGHFDTTRAHIEHAGAIAIDLPADISKEDHFKGNMNVVALEELIKEQGKEKIPLIMMTITNNIGGGQPVSMSNLKEVSSIASKYGIPFFIDACRFAENSWFIKTREKGYEETTPIDIARDIFSLADGCTMSAKKDGMANMGGFLALNDEKLAEKCKVLGILTEGFSTYGGMAGYDMETVAIGLYESLEEDYLRYRIGSLQYIGEKLKNNGIPLIYPVGGHAIYLDAGEILPHVPPLQYPGWSFNAALYLLGGIRGCEIGSVMFGSQPDGTEKPASRELVRLAFPRRVYTQSHADYLIEVILAAYEQRDKLRGYKIVEMQPVLRHFSCRLLPL